MNAPTADANIRPPYDRELLEIAHYTADYAIESREAYETARLCLMDALGCAFLALRFPACARHLGPLIPGTVTPDGSRVPGDALCARSRQSSLRYRRPGALARF